MKKTLLILTLILSSIYSNAQNSKFEFGPEIGLNLCNYTSSNDNFDDISITRLSFGVVAKYNFSEKFSLKSKIKYDGKGSRSKDESFDDKLDYITVPLLAEYNFGSNKIRGFLNLGLFTGFLSSAKSETYGNEEIDIKESIKSTDFGLAYGIGMIYKLNEKMNLTFELGGQSSLSELEENSNSEIKTKNQIFSSNFGLTFNL